MVLIRLARQWWTQSDTTSLIKAQDKLLQTFVKTPFTRTIAEESVGGLNSVEFRSSSSSSSNNNKSNNNDNENNETDKHTVILAHGFGSGLGFFYHNVDMLLQHPSINRVILVDWLGMGGSNRPDCHLRPIRRITTNCWSTTGWCESYFTTTSQAVDFFVDPFSEWMDAITNETTNDNNQQQEKFILVGHSLGGYLAARYMLSKNASSAITKLVLASPVGFPNKPLNVLQGSQLPTTFRIMDALWSSNMTPQQLVRLMGSKRGRYNTKRALLGRIPQLISNNNKNNNTTESSESSSEESIVDILGEYLYHITVAPPSGEYAMNSLLEPVISPDTMGVFARESLQELFSNYYNSSTYNTNTSLRTIKVLYGDHDWMRNSNNEISARETMTIIQKNHHQQILNFIQEENNYNYQNSNPIHTSVDIISNSGHHLYLDNPNEFVNHIVVQ